MTNSPEMMLHHSDHATVAAFWTNIGPIKPDPGMVNGNGSKFHTTRSRSNKRNQGSGRGSSCKKRESHQTQNPKDVAEEESNITLPNTNSTDRGSSATDYIHVRARRGQATDSHSLAERVRREKISQRMKYLQDLVPGCNRVAGKAGILDEIINYVQSLQRQVEFLSMKLAAVNPTMDLKLDSYLAKEMFPATVGPSSHMVNPVNVQINTLDHASFEMDVNLIDIALRRGISVPVSIPDAAFLDSWEDELQNLYNMECLQGSWSRIMSSSNMKTMHSLSAKAGDAKPKM